MKKLNVLIGCEFSAAVRDTFAARGHNAWSCDLLPSEKGGQHYQGDIFEVLVKQKWDLIILHPPCTCIALCGNSTYGKGMHKHHDRIDSIVWTKKLWEMARLLCPKVAMENPKNVMGKYIGKKTQSIQPYEFGHLERKETWLWLHGLPPLKATNNVYNDMMKLPKCKRERLHYMSPSPNRGHERSRTFEGIADAMANQWS